MVYIDCIIVVMEILEVMTSFPFSSYFPVHLATTAEAQQQEVCHQSKSKMKLCVEKRLRINIPMLTLLSEMSARSTNLRGILNSRLLLFSVYSRSSEHQGMNIRYDIVL